MVYDLAVIGAGPAGSYAAYEAACKGYSVVLLEKERLPRYKLCGGAISKKTLDFFKGKGIEIPGDIIENRVKGAFISTPLHSSYVQEEKTIAILTYRDVFDYFLTGLAKGSGVRVMDKARFKGIKNGKNQKVVYNHGEVLEADHIFGADGAGSLVAKKSSLIKGFSPEEVGVAAEVEIPMEKSKVRKVIGTNRIEIYFGDSSFSYSWVFPKREGLTVGVAELGAKLGKKKTIDDILRAFIQKIRYLKGIKIPAKKTHLIPLGGIERPVARRGVTLLGDAAGFVDPLTGEGIYWAIKSSELAVESLGDNAPHKSYQKKINDHILKELKASLKLARLMYLKPDYSYYLFKKADFFKSLPLELSKGSISTQKLYKRALKTSIKALPSYLLEWPSVKA